jgi:hypothetical protein
MSTIAYDKIAGVNMRHVGDVCAAGLGVACLIDWLPPTAAFFSIVWLVIQIFDYFYKKKWRK